MPNKWCAKCQKLFDDANFCSQCGGKTTEAPSKTGAPANAQELTNTTSAVRAVAAAQTDADKSKTYGQQKWGLFETNYQRSTNTTLDESLNEIDRFAKGGVIVGQTLSTTNSGKGSAGNSPSSSHSTTTSTTTTTRSGGSAGSPGSLNPGKFGPGSGARQAPNSNAGAAKFKPGGNAGAAFLNQHKAKEAAKYKPGYMNK